MLRMGSGMNMLKMFSKHSEYKCPCGKELVFLGTVKCDQCSAVEYCSDSCLKLYRHRHEDDCKNHLDILNSPGYFDCLNDKMSIDDIIMILTDMSVRNASDHPYRVCYNNKFKQISIKIGRILHSCGSYELMLDVLNKIPFKHDIDRDELIVVWEYIGNWKQFILSFEFIGSFHDNACHVCKTKVDKLLRCSRCKTVKYCSKKCQRNHWARHEQVCKIHLEPEQIPNVNDIDDKTSESVLIQILEDLSIRNAMISIHRDCYTKGTRKQITLKIGNILYKRGGRELLDKISSWIKVRHPYDRNELVLVWKTIGKN